MADRYGAASGAPRVDAPISLEQPAPLRTVGPVRAVTSPLGAVVASPFSIGTDTGCANAALRVTGGIHATTVLGVGLCPPNVTEGNAWINNELVVGTDPTGTGILRVGGAVRLTGQLISTLATGTAPFSVASTTKVANLNADSLDGFDETAFGRLAVARTWTAQQTFSGGVASPLVIGTDPGSGSTLRIGGTFLARPTTNQKLFIRDSTGLSIHATDDADSVFVPLNVVGNPVTILGGPLIVGADPGGSEALRVGGIARIGSESGVLIGSTVRVGGTSFVGTLAGLFAPTVTEMQLVVNGGDVVHVTPAALTPATAGGLTLGTATLPWASGHFGTSDTGLGGVVRASHATETAFVGKTGGWAAIWTHATVDRQFRIDNTGDDVRFHHGTAAGINTVQLRLSGSTVGAYLAPGSAGLLTLGTASLPWASGSFGGVASPVVRITSTGGPQLELAAVAGDAAIGTSTNHRIRLYTNNLDRWILDATGHLLAFADNTYDIGASGASRPRDVFVARDLVVGGALTANVKLRHSNVTDAGTGANTAETTLMSHTLPTLADGDTVEFFAEFAVTGANSTKTIRAKIGSTTIATVSLAAASTGNGYFRGALVKDGTATKLLVLKSDDAGLGNEVVKKSAVHTIAAELSGASLSITGTTPNSADEVTAEALSIWIYKA